jgi:undecaprenyl-diphosphatase
MWQSIDTAIVIKLNSTLAGDGLYGNIIRGIVFNMGENPIIRGLPVFFSFLILWFNEASLERRSRMSVGLMATCLAVMLSVSMQYLFHVHTRPILDSSLQLNIFENQWDHSSSFPSDTAMLYFCLSSVIFLQNRRFGIWCFLWSSLTAGVCRVAYGWHYPSDIAGSFVIGTTLIYCFYRFTCVNKIIERFIKALGTRMYIAHSFLFLVLADAYNLFPGLRGFFEILIRLIRLSSGRTGL